MPMNERKTRNGGRGTCYPGLPVKRGIILAVSMKTLSLRNADSALGLPMKARKPVTIVPLYASSASEQGKFYYFCGQNTHHITCFSSCFADDMGKGEEL
jgi:hypothetical protein